MHITPLQRRFYGSLADSTINGNLALYFGDKRTIIKDLKKEIGKGLLDSMLEDLEINKDEIEGL
ncbi:hypothetical protein [Endozoicomonas sp. SCSIO W0465]|uniref:hypothetical protein n=1 Tax=Endozoicomonas sp. SCSIO W0465 TaxID=2918516 RepID=UPI00207548C3|nr:hypothetical protein [Endozoicomonas sp. SCSIO W0465]USE39143.1 hypothetical protein MJO57_13880 [Endozoicomonas sp. SCSIO W0465]